MKPRRLRRGGSFDKLKWVPLALAIVIGAYYFGAFGQLATGYLWYDLRRFAFWLYGSILIPASLVFTAYGFGRWILSLLPDSEDDLPSYVRDLRHQCIRFEDRISNVARTSHALHSKVQQLEAKMQVVCSLLRRPDAEKISSNVLEDA